MPPSMRYKLTSLKSIILNGVEYLDKTYAGLRASTARVIEPILISLLMLLSWARLPISRWSVNLQALYRQKWIKIEALQRTMFAYSSLSIKCASGSRALLASASIPTIPSNPRPVRTTEMKRIFGKILGSSTFLPSTFLRLWKTLKLLQ